MASVDWRNIITADNSNPQQNEMYQMATMYVENELSERAMSGLEQSSSTKDTSVCLSIFLSPEEEQVRKEQTKALRSAFNDIKAKQKWLGKTWDTIKIGFNDEDSSANVEKQLALLEKTCPDYFNYPYNIGVIQPASVSFEQTFNTLKGYAEGQRQVIDVTADIAGCTAAGIGYAYAMGGAVAAPFTGGASATQTAVGIAFAGTASAATRNFIKSTNLDDYTWEEQLKDIGRGYVDGVIAPVAAGAEYAAIKGLGKAGWTTAQSAAANIENQLVVGFGRATTRTGVKGFADGLSRYTESNLVNDGIKIQLDREAMKYATSSELRDMGSLLFRNASRDGIRQATALGERVYAQEGMRTAARVLLPGSVCNPNLGERILLNAVRGAAGGATYGGVNGGVEYTINSFENGIPWTFGEFLKYTGTGTAAGAAAGGTIATGSSLIGEGVRAVRTGSAQGKLPFTATEDITLADVPALKSGALPNSQTPFGSLTVPSQKGVATVTTPNGASAIVPFACSTGGTLAGSSVGSSTGTAATTPLADSTTTSTQITGSTTPAAEVVKTETQPAEAKAEVKPIKAAKVEETINTEEKTNPATDVSVDEIVAVVPKDPAEVGQKAEVKPETAKIKDKAELKSAEEKTETPDYVDELVPAIPKNPAEVGQKAKVKLAEAVANKPLPKTKEELRTWCNELNIDPSDTDFLVNNYVNDSNIDIISELIALRINGKPRFDNFNLCIIAMKINPENRDIVIELAKLMNKNEPRFNEVDISCIIENISDKNKNDLKGFINKTDNNGNPLYNTDEITLLLQISLRGLNSKSFHERDLLCSILSKDIKCTKDEKIKMELQKKLDLLKKSINKAIEPIPVSREANNDFWHNFLTTADKRNAEVIRGLDSVVERYCPNDSQGLPLEFSRENFVKELKTILETLPEEQRTEILKKLDIQFKDNSYDGFINLKRFDGTLAKETEILQLCNKFLLENKINTGDPQTDKFLNSIIKAMPEFINIIGKKHHDTHQYTLDGHTLKVLKEVVSNPKFETLSPNDKMIAQLLALFHDIGKVEGTVDTGHESMSSVMANDILSKVNLPEFTKKRIVELIKNHNWLQQMNDGQITPEVAAIMFRNPGDSIIAEIFAEADLKGVGNSFYEIYSPTIKPNVEKIQNALNGLYSTGNVIFQTKILNIDKIPTVEFQGKTYRVLDISKLPDDVDLTQFGLSVKDKKDLRFLFHRGNLEKLEQATKTFNEGYACTTLITPSKKSTYVEDSNLGMILEAPNQNVIGAYNFDQFSPTRQGLNGFLDMAKNDFPGRIYQRDIILKSLSKKYSVTERDYAEIFKQLVNIETLSQIRDVTLSNGTTIKAEDVINAYRTFENDLLVDSGSGKFASYNEVNLYLPQIKGVILMGDSLSEIPAKTLQFTREHNLPIFILGKK